jgi:flagellar export protein FliJ
MVKTLTTLIRYWDKQLDDIRVQLSKAQRHYAGLQNALYGIEQELSQEQEAASLMQGMALTYEAYAKQNKQRQQIIRDELKKTDAMIQALLAQMTELFIERKRFEILKERRMEALTKLNLRIENQWLDEIALQKKTLQ